MRVIQSLRMSRLRARRSRKAYWSEWRTASLAGRNSVRCVSRNPLASLRIFLWRRRAGTPRLTRGMVDHLPSTYRYGSARRTMAASPPCRMTSLLYCRLRRALLCTRRWLFCPFGRARRRHRGQDHDHVLPFQQGGALDGADRLELAGHPVQQVLADVLVNHLTPAEHDGQLHLVPLLQEGLDVVEFGLEVVLTDFGAELHFFDLDVLVLLACIFVFL